MKKKVFTWGPIEERAWNSAKALCTLNLSLTVPEPQDDLVLTTDASKIAASACLFRVKDGKCKFTHAIPRRDPNRARGWLNE